MGKGLVGGVTLGVVLIGGMVVLGNCTTRVPAGYAAVQYSMSGGIKEEVLDQGWHVTSPTIKTSLYTVGLEQSYLTAAKKGDSPNDESFKTPTSDGKTLTVDLEFSYKFDQDKLGEIFTRFKGQSGEDVKDNFIKPKMVAWTQEVTAKYPVTDVFGDKRQELNEALDIYLREKFEPYGIIIDTVNFTNISTDPDTEAAIQKKVTAQQEQELAQIEATTAKINAEKEKEVALINAEKEKEAAEINAQQAVIKAQGQADATLIKAEAEAEAVAKVAAALTSDYVDYTEAQAWNGELPVVQGTSGTIIDMGDITSTEE